MAANVQQLSKWLGAYRYSPLIYVPVKLGIPDLLQQGTKSIDELVNSLAVHPRSLYRVLRLLASLGIFVEGMGQRFGLNQVSEQLCENHPDSLKEYVIRSFEEDFLTWGELNGSLSDIELSERIFREEKALPTSEDTAKLLQMAEGYKPTQILHVTAMRGIPEFVTGTATNEDLAELLQVLPNALRPILFSLADLNILTEMDGGFGSTPLLSHLRKGKPAWNAACMNGAPWHWKTWNDILHSVETGEPSFEHVNNMGTFEYFDSNPAEGSMFDMMIHDLGEQGLPLVLDALDNALEHYDGTFVDVGGGYGGLITGLLKRHPRMQGILFDVPRVLQAAERNCISGGANFSDRCELVAGDFLKSVPEGDVLLIRNLLHDWDDDTASQLLLNCRDALRNNGKLFLMEFMLQPSGDKFHQVKCMMDVTMMLMEGGLERTEAEFRALLKRSGFSVKRMIPTASPVSVIEAEVD